MQPLAMIHLQCSQCGKDWYTANTATGQRCDSCGAVLVEVHSHGGEY